MEYLATLLASTWRSQGLSQMLVDLHREGHLTAAQCEAGLQLVRDLQALQREAGAATARYDERMAAGTRRRDPTGTRHDVLAALTYVTTNLRHHERRTLSLVLSAQSKRGAIADIGRQCSTYSNQKSAKGYAVGLVANLLDTIGELYQERGAALKSAPNSNGTGLTAGPLAP